MTDLASRWGQEPRPIVLDVRTRAEFVLGHIPNACNAPISQIERAPQAIARALSAQRQIIVHCSMGMRSKRAAELLREAGLENLIVVRDSGFSQWKQQGMPSERGLGRTLRVTDERPRRRALLAGIGAGFVATVASGVANAGLSLLVGTEAKHREHRVRRGSPHEVGGTLIAERILKHRPSLAGRLAATLAFNAMYMTVLGVAYTVMRRVAPGTARTSALPLTGAAYFVACDGGVAPALGLTPGPQELPWQYNVKELVNHVVWNATAEALHRADERAYARKIGRER